MKTITLIRLFAFFPLCGIIIPDATFAFHNAQYRWPAIHVAICILIMALIFVSFLIQALYPRLRSR
ncbi:hypothetical protein EOD41_06305 [Mucilaginibacter limnophilus]|uniref:Uncharacterized protein n=1 Tax=Mucilaginibacter limnophilus TaxID=1932778 RepID=A0A3S2UPZ3_9SPHI|nr:hypothetical protein [Mucilaginibacter limnophilus]RVU01575.1 hypothetical protein EOD41_06305 [Mucilaginibacter limnophilus]